MLTCRSYMRSHSSWRVAQHLQGNDSTLFQPHPCFQNPGRSSFITRKLDSDWSKWRMSDPRNNLFLPVILTKNNLKPSSYKPGWVWKVLPTFLFCQSTGDIWTCACLSFTHTQYISWCLVWGFFGIKNQKKQTSQNMKIPNDTKHHWCHLAHHYSLKQDISVCGYYLQLGISVVTSLFLYLVTFRRFV